MVDEAADGDLRGELGDAADVVDVIVGDDEVVDLADASLLAEGDDAVGVAGVGGGPAGVDEEAFAGGGDEEGRLTAFDVGEVDLEGAGFLGESEGGGHQYECCCCE